MPNVKVTGLARLYARGPSVRRERCQPPGWTKPLRGEIHNVEPDSKCDLAPSPEGLFQTNNEVTRRWKRCQTKHSSRTTLRTWRT